jgi:hypothetical protein
LGPTPAVRHQGVDALAWAREIIDRYKELN